MSATARAGGDGSAEKPFDSLSAVEQASAPGDAIVVLPSPAGTPPLDGGIALQKGQHLRGAPPAPDNQLGAVPRITNGSADRNAGDAVVLADGVEVEGLVIVDPYRGGVYGADVTSVAVHDLDVSGHNVSCTEGFFIPGFTPPTTTPGVSIALASGLKNGWAAIMIDETAVSGTVSIRTNHVHDAVCGDGIDLRLHGSAEIDAEIADNVVEDIAEGPAFQSLLAVGMQVEDESTLHATLDGNRQTNIGSPGADSEGVFAELVGSAELVATVDHDDFANGLGGFSANGVELVILAGNPSADLRIRNSTFVDVPGDVIEAGNLGTGASMNVELDGVVAKRSNGPGDTGLLPFNNGDCLLAAMGGSDNTLTVTVHESELSDCVNNGVTLGSNPIPLGASNALLGFEIAGSTITGNRNYNVRLMNLGGLGALHGSIQGTDLSHGQGTNLAIEERGTTARAELDLGGGSAGSTGENCIAGAGALDATIAGFQVMAQHDWWGDAAGPLDGRTAVSSGGSLDLVPPLSEAPARCR